MVFRSAEETDTVGSVFIFNLEPNTNYSATLRCVLGQSFVNENVTFKTDYGRPSAPRNVSARLVSRNVEIKWSPPSTSSDSFTYYKLEIDNKSPGFEIPKNQTSYATSDVYVDGTRYTFQVSTCYRNNQGKSVCSDRNEGKSTFLIPVVLSSSSPVPVNSTSTTTTASDAPISSISMPTILLSLFLISKIF